MLTLLVKDKGSRPNNNDFLLKNENYKKETNTMLRGMYMSRYTHTHTFRGMVFYTWIYTWTYIPMYKIFSFMAVYGIPKQYLL